MKCLGLPAALSLLLLAGCAAQMSTISGLDEIEELLQAASASLRLVEAAGDSFYAGDGMWGVCPSIPQSLSRDFELSTTEVTNAQFALFMADGGYEQPLYWTDNGWTWLTGSADPRQPRFWDDPALNGARQPVVGVSWYEAVAFCNWLSMKDGRSRAYGADGRVDFQADGYRLPTEMEWEYVAAKGAPGEQERLWPNCSEVDHVDAVYGAPYTEDVGSRSSGDTPQGFSDMAGNALEWCCDTYTTNDTFDDGGSEDHYTFTTDAPGTMFVTRGGGWDFGNPQWLRAANRIQTAVEQRRESAGFRVLRPR